MESLPNAPKPVAGLKTELEVAKLLNAFEAGLAWKAFGVEGMRGLERGVVSGEEGGEIVVSFGLTGARIAILFAPLNVESPPPNTEDPEDEIPPNALLLLGLPKALPSTGKADWGGSDLLDDEEFWPPKVLPVDAKTDLGGSDPCCEAPVNVAGLPEANAPNPPPETVGATGTLGFAVNADWPNPD